MFFSQRIGLSLVLAYALTGCGNDAGFSGESGKRANSDAVVENPPAPTPTPPPADNPTVEPYAGLTWFWQCDENPVQTPAELPEEKVFEGVGPHTVDLAKLKDTPLTFSGHLCEPEAMKRDIVFVVDVSGSMNGNDPRVGNNCGRLSAIEAVMASAAGGVANFGVVTFEDNIPKSSNMLFDSAQGMYADASITGNIADTICRGQGGTNYDAGLTRAAELLQAGREGATKEIYFISDGKPNGGQDGIAIANSLKATGLTINNRVHTVRIATVMLAGQDEVLEKYIASVDSSGKPMHAYVNQAAQLAQVLTDLSDNTIVGAELRYRLIGTDEYTVLNLMDHLQGFDFVLPSITIEGEGASQGLEVEYEYWDQHDNRFVTGGKLLWTAVSSDSAGKNP